MMIWCGVDLMRIEVCLIIIAELGQAEMLVMAHMVRLVHQLILVNMVLVIFILMKVVTLVL